MRRCTTLSCKFREHSSESSILGNQPLPDSPSKVLNCLVRISYLGTEHLVRIRYPSAHSLAQIRYPGMRRVYYGHRESNRWGLSEEPKHSTRLYAITIHSICNSILSTRKKAALIILHGRLVVTLRFKQRALLAENYTKYLGRLDYLSFK